jgi:hypothetical protein
MGLLMAMIVLAGLSWHQQSCALHITSSTAVSLVMDLLA